MANFTVCQCKWKPIVEPRRAKPKTYRQAPTHWLKFFEEAMIESEARTAVVQLKPSYTPFKGNMIYLVVLENEESGNTINQWPPMPIKSYKNKTMSIKSSIQDDTASLYATFYTDKINIAT